MKNTARFFIFLGLTLLIFTAYLIWQRYTPKRLAFNLNQLSTTNSQSSTQPQILTIPDLHIELPILPAKLTNGQWEATTQGVSYLISSPTPGNLGNSIIYGHNWPSLLGKLTKSRPGQIIQIKFSDGATKNFEISYTQIITPDQTHILNPSNDSRLTLYTCTGFLDSKRFVVTAIYKPS